MNPRTYFHFLLPHVSHLGSLLCAGSLLLAPVASFANDGNVGRYQGNLVTGDSVPSGVEITPSIARGAVFKTLNPDLPTRPDFVAGQAVTSITSPDEKNIARAPAALNEITGRPGRASRRNRTNMSSSTTSQERRR